MREVVIGIPADGLKSQTLLVTKHKGPAPGVRLDPDQRSGHLLQLPRLSRRQHAAAAPGAPGTVPSDSTLSLLRRCAAKPQFGSACAVASAGRQPPVTDLLLVRAPARHRYWRPQRYSPTSAGLRRRPMRPGRPAAPRRAEQPPHYPQPLPRDGPLRAEPSRVRRLSRFTPFRRFAVFKRTARSQAGVTSPRTRALPTDSVNIATIKRARGKAQISGSVRVGSADG